MQKCLLDVYMCKFFMFMCKFLWDFKFLFEEMEMFKKNAQSICQNIEVKLLAFRFFQIFLQKSRRQIELEITKGCIFRQVCHKDKPIWIWNKVRAISQQIIFFAHETKLKFLTDRLVYFHYGIFGQGHHFLETMKRGDDVK